eukprot:TRINITY_DN1455_c0_g1_i4.p1 TRINITY_DN1455_c0_g1~~TRINITY_DN1455_c0_g1_i4.p1  ORF type:complete len:1350 (-),score=326.54 TRINITY_DN1455_c0_g1_i4:44-4093(-)
MCIRDRYQRRVRGLNESPMAVGRLLLGLALCQVALSTFVEYRDIILPEESSDHSAKVNYDDDDHLLLPLYKEESTLTTAMAPAPAPNVAARATSAFVDKLTSYCSSTAFGTNADMKALCVAATTGPAKELLSKVTTKLADAAFTGYDCCSITFKIGSVSIGKAKFEFTGTIGYASGVLSISASTGTQTAAINDYVTMTSLNLGVSANLSTKKIVTAQIDGSVTVSLGFGDSTSGSVLVSLVDNGFSMSAALKTAEIKLSSGFTLLAGTVDLSYASGTMIVALQADASVTYSAKDGPIVVSVTGSYDSSTQAIALSGTMSSMIPKIFGADALSAGMFTLDASMTKGKVASAKLTGVLCVGSTASCQAGTATANNIVSQLTLSYKQANPVTLLQALNGVKTTSGTGQWLFVAKISTLDVRKAISAFGDAALAKKLPEVLNLGLKPLQTGCTAASPLDSCFFLIAVTTVSVDLTNISPAVRLTPGLTLLAKFQLPPTKKTTLLQLNLPIHGSTVTVPGSNLAAKFSLSMSTLNNEQWSTTNPIGQTKLPALLSLGQGKSDTKLIYDMKFSAVLPLAIDAAKTGVPALKSLSMPSALTKSLNYFDKLMDKFPMQLEMNSDFTSKASKYFAVTGKANNGGIGVTFIVNRQTVGATTTTAIMASVALNTQYFGELIKLMLKTNPFDKVPSLSNMYVAGYASSGAFQLPTPVTLPTPFEGTRDIKAGFCFHGKLMRPSKSCGLDPVCAVVKSAFSGSSSNLVLSGCVSGLSTSLMIGVAGIKLSKSVTIRTAGLTYDSTIGPPPSVSFGASATLDVIINKEPVTFNGKLYLAQKAATTLLGFSFTTSGMFVRAFGVQRLNMYDLILAAEVGVAAGVPVINSNTIGGGICFGPADKCKPLVKGTTVLEQQELSLAPKHEDYANHVALVEQAKLTGAVAMKLYAGFDLAGDAFFYAGITKVTLADIASAFVGASKLPSWLGKVGLEGYDTAACKANAGGSACFAYMSFASKEKTITELSPPMTIPMGFNTQGRLTLFGASIGFKMQLIESKMAMQLDASPLNLFSGAIQVFRVKDDFAVSTLAQHTALGTDEEEAQHSGQRTALAQEEHRRQHTALLQEEGSSRRRRRSTKAPTKAPTDTRRRRTKTPTRAPTDVRRRRTKTPTKAPTAEVRRRRSPTTASPTVAVIAARRRRVAYDSTKGPFFSFDADLKTKNFALAFNGYAKIKGLGEAGIKVAVTPTSFEGTLVSVPVFSSPITMDLTCKLTLNTSPTALDLAAALDVSALTSMTAPLLKATQAAIKPINALKKTVEKARDVVNKAFKKAKGGLDKAKKAVSKACLLYTSPSPRDRTRSRMPSSA